MARRSFAAKRVLLTGASSGIGWYLASELVRAGAFVVVTSRRADRLQQLRLAFGNPRKRLLAVPGDLACPAHRQTLIDTAVEQLGGIDIVINNAGVGAIGKFEEASADRLRQIFEVDFFAATELTRLALPFLEAGREPAVCTVSSVLGHRAVPGKSEYCAAKFALRGWAEALRVELHPKGIDVINISPSTTKSEFFDSLVASPPSTAIKSYGVQSAEYVAHRILGAIRKRKRDLILSPGGNALVWLSRLAPGLTDQLLLRFAA
ncbi:MAG: SDR family NAD(P)-dependent oxidoreductase [Planctomycetales bacterium]|nr:SDR family NAD(P)-dependent oxidoreductase [Planctomycetales bacterium]